MACDNVKSGLFDYVVNYDVPTQGNDLNTMIRTLISKQTPAGETKVILYSPTKIITADNVSDSQCWSLDALQ